MIVVKLEGMVEGFAFNQSPRIGIEISPQMATLNHHQESLNGLRGLTVGWQRRAAPTEGWAGQI
jgi:hypothetical protein